MKDCVKITGELMVEWLRDGQVVKRRVYKNKITTLGLALLASLAAGAGTAPSHIALGSGYTPATAGDLTLQTEVARAAITSTTHPANSLQYTATFGPSVGTGTHREAGLFNAGSGGTMSNRSVFTTPLVKASYETVNIIWLITFN